MAVIWIGLFDQAKWSSIAWTRNLSRSSWTVSFYTLSDFINLTVCCCNQYTIFDGFMSHYGVTWCLTRNICFCRYYHPSNGGSWTSSLEQFLQHLVRYFLKRLTQQRLVAHLPRTKTYLCKWNSQFFLTEIFGWNVKAQREHGAAGGDREISLCEGNVAADWQGAV